MKLWAMLITVGLLLFCHAGAPLAADLQGDAAKKDFEKLQGTWILVSGEMDGSKVPDESASKSSIKYEGDKITVITPHQHGEPMIAEIVKLDATKSPKQMHFVRKNGPSAGKTIVAIYEFDGDNLYAFAFDPTGATTPKELAAKAKSGHIKHAWKRQPK